MAMTTKVYAAYIIKNISLSLWRANILMGSYSKILTGVIKFDLIWQLIKLSDVPLDYL